jgi:4-hydroxybenzoate polyprenyltransferase
VFLGFSLVAALKDHKDIDADRAAGVTTIYTLAERRGWPLERVHRIVVTLSCVALLLPMPLLASIERAPWAASVAPLPFVALLAFVSWRSRGRFGWTLLLVSAVLASLVITLA